VKLNGDGGPCTGLAGASGGAGFVGLVIACAFTGAVITRAAQRALKLTIFRDTLTPHPARSALEGETAAYGRGSGRAGHVAELSDEST
jgi:hypothetical protein